MELNYYRFHLGKFECISLLDGSMDYPIQNIYSNVSRAQVEAVLSERHLPVDVVTTPYTYLYVDTGSQHLLVDAGAGDLGPRTGHLIESFKSAGISSAEIDSVLLSHAHPDHIGGLLDDQGMPMYPLANYYLWKDEWSFWFSEGAAAKTSGHFISTARHALEPLKDRVTLIVEETEIFPGVRLIPAPGHTPGHMVVQFQSAGENLLYIGDTVIQPLHLEYPDWLPIYDIQPEKAAASKQRIFDLAAKEHYLVLGQHFPPFPSLGYVAKRDNGWVWTPALPESKVI